MINLDREEQMEEDDKPHHHGNGGPVSRYKGRHASYSPATISLEHPDGPFAEYESRHPGTKRRFVNPLAKENSPFLRLREKKELDAFK